MRVPIGWLKEFVDIDISAAELAERLTMAGLEAAEIDTERFGLGSAAVGRVVSIEQHPGRPDYRVVKAAAAGGTLTLVTNLPGLREGMELPVAFEGFVFPDGSVLEPKKMGGVQSDAKIVSEADVEVSDRADTILSLPAEALPDDNLADLLGITETVIKFDLTSNRGDCHSILGIARETAALLNKPLLRRHNDGAAPFTEPGEACPVTIRDKALCPRYTGRIIRDIRVTASPVWMKRRLIAAGMRPISGIVDVTNYVMLETGQPLHAFDMDTLKGGRIIVRRAARGETMLTLDGSERKLTTDMLVIADAERAVAVAGVMGGAETEVTDKTTTLLLEAACFNPFSIRRTARALDLRTEASLRFEKSVDLEHVSACSDRASDMIRAMGWGRPAAALSDAFPGKCKPKKITVSVKKINDVLGTQLDDATIRDTLGRLAFKVDGTRTLKVEVPPHRADVSIAEDLAEETARIYGYNEIPMELPVLRAHRAIVTEGFRVRRTLRSWMCAMGLDEAFNYSIVNRGELTRFYGEENMPDAIDVSNPMTGFNALRPSLLPGLLRSLAHNIAHGNEDVFLFELGRIFRPLKDGSFDERDSLAFIIMGRGLQLPTQRQADAFHADYGAAKGIVEGVLERAGARAVFRKTSSPVFHPARSAEALIDGEKAAVFGEMHPSLLQRNEINRVVCAGILKVDRIAPLLERTTAYKHISRFPSVPRDLSFIVSESVAAGDITNVIREKADDMLESLALVDVFRSPSIGDGKKSVTFSLKFRRADRTLSEEEIQRALGAVTRGVKDGLGGFLRES